MKPHVSVVVPTCRRPHLLDRCLDALVAQDLCPSQYEILVVDDAVCDETRCRVERRARELRAGGPCLRYVRPTVPRLPSRRQLPKAKRRAGAHLRRAGVPLRLRGRGRSSYLGPAAARNAGWRAARGGIIAFTDDDCIPAPDWLRAGLVALAVGADGASGRLIMPLPARPTDYERNACHLERAEFVTANCFYRRAALADAGGFDERFTLAWREDTDLQFRLLARGAHLVTAPDAVVIHPLRPAPWGVSLSQQRKSMFNALLYKKHPTLYRERIQSAPPWRYYLIAAAALLAFVATVRGRGRLAVIAVCVWSLLTGQFCVSRLAGTSRSPSHVAEMVVTSVAIPVLSIYWRLRGAVKYRVVFF